MTRRADFSNQEWAILGNAPLAAAAAVALADPGHGARESEALITAWHDGGALYQNVIFIQELVEDFNPERPRFSTPPPKIEAVTILEEATQLCQMAIALLSARASEEECNAYSNFVIHIATQVAEAAGSGFLNFGGPAVSLSEQSTLRAIRIALDPNLI